ncbi:YDG domain-containing protein [Janthinobacterium sp. J1-1]|uniref:YDG domain-containing protein n=1 Tax=Janthinobacterium sp. J1-1 TaxID=3065910 RepID=UPI002811FD0F|nr:YDG domain-containing protein [Janthinobacterium sp. J1-1]
MNRIYRSIWNQATGAYAAVSENVKSAGKRSMPGSAGGGAHLALTSMAAALMLGYGSLALAGPTGGTVVAGQANITGAPGSTVIKQGSQNAVINWANFNINQGESVQFVQPNSHAVALNRVLGNDGTTILGNLSANGKVFIVNPNGILFGQGASVNTAGLVASMLDINNADFMAGSYKFSGNGTGKVLNQGSISAPGGYVALLGANVSNEGTINARLGSVALAAGRAITLDVAGDGLLNVAVDQGAVGALVQNGGLIQADGGSVLLTAQAAGDLLKTVVNNTGVIEAHTIDTRSGTIKLLGDMQTGTVNASGTLDASAPTGGNGGFIETSAAKVKMADALKITTSAVAGKGLTGTWLIDPTDFTIAASGGDQTGAFYTNALKTTDVHIQTVASGAGLGNINVNDTILWSANQLKLTAHNNININAPLRGSGTATLALRYGQSAPAAGNLATYNVKAEIDLPSGKNFSTLLGIDGATTVYTVVNSLGAAGSMTGTDLQGLRNVLGENIVLGANIDASITANTGIWGANGFAPIGSAATPFTGQFDGLGHTIHGLSITNTTASGIAALFGATSSTASVRNIGLANVAITGNIASGLYGQTAALVGINSGIISNAFVGSGTVSGIDRTHTGGLVALNQGTITDSYNNAAVSRTGTNTGGWLGGLVGEAEATSNITNSYNSGSVTGLIATGGLVGNNKGSISNSFNSGVITGRNDVGGLVVHNRAGGVITNSYNTGAVSGGAFVGGLVSQTYTNGSGFAASVTSNSYSTGTVTAQGLGVASSANTATGGLIGANKGVLSDSYATGAVIGASGSTVGTNSGVGGVVGLLGVAGNVARVYSSGTVSLKSGATGTMGGVVGLISATTGTLANGFYNTTVNPAIAEVGTNTIGGTVSVTRGLTSSEMQTGSNFEGFNFTTKAGATGNNWVMVNTDGTLNGAGNKTGATWPMLSAEYSTNIYSSHQLQLMAMNLAGNYTLKQDINAASTGTTGDVWNGATFVPVGASTGTPFTGTFDGTGHVISGLVINRPGTNSAGLFGATSSTAIVRNVGLEGGSITGMDATGALVGSNLGRVSGSYSTASVTGGTQVGGLVGSNLTGGTVTNSYASGAVTGTGTLGGLVGTNNGTLTNNYASGTVTGGITLGGVTGSNNGTASGNFWDTTTSNLATNANASGIGTGLSTAQMKLLSVYTGAGWDLTSTWIVYDTNTYPLLRAFMTPLQVTFAANASKTYNATTTGWTAPGVTSSNSVAYAALQGTLNYGAAGSAVNAGTYAITAGGLYSGQRGYAINSSAATLTINKLAATLNGGLVQDRVYDGTTTATIQGGILSGILTVDKGKVTATGGNFDTSNAGTGKTVTLVSSGTAGGNYTITASGAGLTGTITPKELSLSGMTATDRQYNASRQAVLTGGTLNGLVGSETLTLGTSSGTYDNANAGTGKAVTVTLGALGNDTGLASNYTLAAPTDITGTVTPKVLTVGGVTAGDKVYDGLTSAIVGGGTLSGLVDKETLTAVNSGEFSDKNVANGKTVTVSTTLSNGNFGGLASNYTVANFGVTASITPKALTVTGATAGNKAYDGNTAATISGGALSGMVGSETINLGALSGSFSDKNAGTGKAVTVTGGTLSDGSNGGLASNYTVGSITGLSADITQKALTVTGVTVGSKTYDGNTSATVSGGTLNGLVGGETLGLSGQTGVFIDRNAGNGKAVTVSGATLSDGSGLASNYTVSNATGVTGNITQKALTVGGVTAADKVYDGGLAAVLSGGTLSGMVGSETLGLSSLSGVFGDKNVGSGKTVTVTGGALSDGTGLASNYTVGAVTGLLASITPKALTLSGVLASAKVYDGNTKASLTAGTLNGLVGGESLSVSGLTGTFANQNAGTGKAVTVTGTTLVDGTGLASNYSVSNPTGVTGDITPKALTVSGLVAANKVYDATTKATVTGGTLSGLVGGETLGLSGLSGTFVNKNAGTAKAVTISGATLADGTGLASNYTVSNPTGVTANINQATISSVTNVVADSKAYDGGTSVTFGSATATFNGMLSGDSLAIGATKASFSDKNAGTGKAVTISFLTLGGTDAGNYLLASSTATGTGTITPKALTISGMSVINKVYDGTTKATLAGGSVVGLVGSENIGVTGLSATFDDKNAGTGKTATATGASLVDGVNGGLAANYTISNPTGLLANITPKALTVTGVTATTRAYDGTLAATLSGGSLSGLVSGETLVVSGGTGAYADKNAGTGKAVTVTGVGIADGTGLASNYTVSNPTGVTGTITQKTLTVTGALAADKTYDGSVAAGLTGGTLDSSGFVGGETVNLASLTGAFADKNAGSGKAVSITGGTLSNGTNGGLASNYSVGPVTGLTASIAQKALTVTGVAAANKVYDATTKATVTGGTLSGLVGGETLGLSGLSGTFADKNAGTAKAVTISGATLADGTGLASNYTVSNPTGVTANINQATISSVTNVVADSKAYDGGTAVTFGSATATFNGMLSGDSLAIGATKASFSDKNAGTGKAVTISFLTLGGTDAGNYLLASSTATGTGTITPKALTISGMSVINKVYDGTTKATLAGGSVVGLVGSENIGVTGLSATFDDKNAGTGKTATATGASLVNGVNGGLAANYTISNPTGLLANITPKALTVTGVTAASRDYDGTKAAALSGGSLSGVVTGESLTLSGLSGSFATQNAGNNIVVTVSGAQLADGANGLASNYTVSNPGNVAANITQKALTISGMSASGKVYDGTFDAVLSGGTLQGLVNDETITITGKTGVFTDKNAGLGKDVRVQTLELTNGTGLASNYSVSVPMDMKANIAQKELAVGNVTALDKTYDGTVGASFTGGALSGFVKDETVGLASLAGKFADQNAGSGKDVSITGGTLSDGTNGGLASNYIVASSAGLSASISQKVLTITGVTAGNKTYDGSDTAILSGGTLNGLVGTETLSLSGQSGRFSDKNAGTNKDVTVSGATLGDAGSGATAGLASNYKVDNATGVKADIAQKALTVSGATALDKTYDGNTVAALAGGALNGLVGSETLALSAAFADKNAAAGKAVTVSLNDGSGLAGNYVLNNPTSLTATIDQKALTVTGVTAGNKTYDGNDKATLTGGVLNGLVGTETLSLSGQSGVFSDKNVGIGKTVTVSGATLGNAGTGATAGLASNYTVGNASGVTATIAQKALTVSGATALDKTYDGNTAAALAGGALDGLVDGETLALSAAFADKAAAAGKAVTVALNDGSGLAGNYVLNNPTGLTAAITPKALTVSGVTAGNKTYDGTLAASLSGGTLNGLVGTETLSLSGQSGVFSDKNAGIGKTVTVSGATLGDAGSGATAGLASNYTVGNATGVTANIAQKALTVSGATALDKTYDGNTVAALAGGALNGLVDGETLALTAAFADKNAAAGKAVTVSLNDGSGLAGNYVLNNPTSLTATIDQKALTVTGVTAGNKTYDGNDKATLTGGVLNGLVGTETLSLSGQSGVFSDKNVGIGKDVTVNGATLGNAGSGATAGLASNYKVDNATGVKADIAQKAVTVSGATALDKIYDGNTVAALAGGALNGLVDGETLALSAAFADKNAAAGKAVTVALNDGSGLAGNYVLNNPTGLTAAITPKALTVSGVTAGNKTYDGTRAASLSGGTLNGLVGTETLSLSGQSGVFGDKNAGSGKTVTVSGATLGNAGSGATAGLASNYTVGNATGVKADIAQKQLTVGGITAGNKVYDGGTAAALDTGSATFGGLVTGDSLNASASGAFSDKNAAAGKTVNISGIVLGGVDAGNYTLDSTTATAKADITAKALTVTGQLAGNKVYDGNTVASLSGGALSGLVDGETLGIAGQTAEFSDKNAANGKTVTVTGTTLVDTSTGLASNYSVSNPTGLTASITAKALTVTGQLAGNKVYDGNAQASLSGGALSGLVAGETLGFGGQSAVFSDKNAANGKTVTVTGTTLVDTATGLASNYSVSNPTGLTASITAKALTVTGQLAGNKVYDGNTVASLSGGALNGLIAGETLGFGGQNAVFSDKNAANGKTVTVTGTTLVDTSTGLASNYSVSNPTGLTASITAKALTVTGQLAGNKVYDGNTAAQLSGGTLSGLVAGETLVIGGQNVTFADKNAGTAKAVTVTGTTLVDTATGLASNYTVSNPTGLTASITAKALTVTGQLAGNKVYDGNTQASLSGGALSGLVAGETLGFGGQNAVFSDKNAANGKAVMVTGTTLVDTATGLASNYTVSNPTGLTASITAKALTVTGQLAGNKVYDGNAQASLSGGTLSGLVAGETLAFGGQNAVFSDKNAANGKTVTVTGTTLVDTANGLASNYTVSNPTGLTASITAKALTVTGQLAGNKVYDGTAQASLSGGALSGLVAGETLVIGGQNATFADKNAGTAKAVTVTGTTLVDTSTGLASNYTVSNPTGLTASITPKALTVAGQLATNKVYDGTTAAQLSGGVLAGLVAGESLGLAGQTATFADKNAATAKAVTVTGTTLVDTSTGLASNYTVSNPTGLTASITPASLLVRATGAASRVYDTTTNASVTLGDNRIAGDVLTISNSGASFADKNAGANKTVTVNGIALGGADAGNYIVNTTATTTASITQAGLGVKVDNAEKDQGRANPAFTASYTGLLGGDTLANEVSGNLAFTTPATTGSPSGSYVVSAAGQASTNYALTYTPGVLTVNPTEALQSAVASVIAAVNVAPSQGNMVQAEVVAKGETVTSKEDAVQVAVEGSQPQQQGSAPVVQTTASVNSNVLPGLRLNVIDTGLRLPVETGSTSIESQ